MEQKGQTREDFSGQLGSLFGGGIAVFADAARIHFIAAVAFSGGTLGQDEDICRIAVERSGLYTDVAPKENPTKLSIRLIRRSKRLIWYPLPDSPQFDSE